MVTALRLLPARGDVAVVEPVRDEVATSINPPDRFLTVTPCSAIITRRLPFSCYTGTEDRARPGEA